MDVKSILVAGFGCFIGVFLPDFRVLWQMGLKLVQVPASLHSLLNAEQ